MKITIGIILVLLIAIFGLLVYPERCQLHITKSVKTLYDVKYLSEAVEAYQAENGTLPTSLKVLIPKYIVNSPREIWGKGYRYDTADDGGFKVYSLGSDGKVGGIGTAADIYKTMEVTNLIHGILKPVWGCYE